MRYSIVNKIWYFGRIINKPFSLQVNIIGSSKMTSFLVSVWKIKELKTFLEVNTDNSTPQNSQKKN